MRFSIVTVVLDDLAGLMRTYGSVRGQTDGDYEWLVMDGDSNDGTKEWLAQLRFERLIWHSQPDDGLYDAMNRGIARARGDYLVFLNAGDEFANRAVLEDVSSVAREGAFPHLIYGDAIDVAGDGTELYRRARAHSALWWTMFACHQAMFFQRARIGELRYRLWYRHAADYAFAAEFLDSRYGRDSARVRRLQRPLCRFWLGGSSAVNRRDTIAEDYLIRARYLHVPAPLNIVLFLLHQVHTWVKRTLPWVARTLRGQKRVPP